jgi:hypothetical protein
MTNLKAVGCGYAEWIHVAHGRSSGVLMNTTASLRVAFKIEKIFTSSANSQEKLFCLRVVRHYEWTGSNVWQSAADH